MYHGTPAERAELRRTVMSLPSQQPVRSKKKSKPVPKMKTKAKAPPAPVKRSQRRSGRFTKVVEIDSDDEEEMTPDELSEADEEDIMSSFPVVITTYEMIIKDRIHLANYNWGYIVVDEGHRLKNLDCKLMQEIKKYTSAGRMILTGTPLHVCVSLPPCISTLTFSQNNLAELWSLLNFILPDIFNDVDSFQEWYVA